MLGSAWLSAPPLPRSTPLEMHREEPRRHRPVERFAAAPARTGRAGPRHGERSPCSSSTLSSFVQPCTGAKRQAGLGSSAVRVKADREEDQVARRCRGGRMEAKD